VLWNKKSETLNPDGWSGDRTSCAEKMTGQKETKSKVDKLMMAKVTELGQYNVSISVEKKYKLGA
jgi:hypothetical protein